MIDFFPNVICNELENQQPQHVVVLGIVKHSYCLAEYGKKAHELIGFVLLGLPLRISHPINREAGVVVQSRELGEAFTEIMERDMSPENSWQVLLDSDGEPYWINSDEVLHTQPSRGGEQRVMNLIFKMFPRDQY